MSSCWPRGLLRQMFSPIFCPVNRRRMSCAARDHGPSACAKRSVVTSLDKISVRTLEQQWASSTLAAHVLTVVLSRESTTEVLCRIEQLPLRTNARVRHWWWCRVHWCLTRDKRSGSQNYAHRHWPRQNGGGCMKFRAFQRLAYPSFGCNIAVCWYRCD